MPAAISVVTLPDGRKYEEAFFAGTGKEFNPAWHGLGHNCLTALKSKDAMQAAHMNWLVEVVPAQSVYKGIVRTRPDFCHTVREDTGAILGRVSDGYPVVQNWEAFSLLDSLVSNGEILYESAGALYGGEVTWVLARDPRIDEIAEGDLAKRYLLFTNSHDGSSAIRCLPTQVRVVCANTLAIALKNSDGIRIKHSGDVKAKMKQAADILRITYDVFNKTVEQQRILATKTISKDDFVAYVDELWPKVVDEDGKPATDGRKFTIRENIVDKVEQNFYRDERQLMKSIKGTAWAAYNAVSQYVDHDGRIRVTDANVEAQSRMNNAVLPTGSGTKLKQKAFAAAIEMFA